MKTLKENTTRPTGDRVKEALFSIIAGDIYNSRVLDLFSGTGSLGIEALSRGAQFCTFVDNSRKCELLICENLGITGFEGSSKVTRGDVFKVLPVLPKESFELILLDPPYEKGFSKEALGLIDFYDLLTSEGVIVAEQSIKDPVNEEYGRLKLLSRHKYKDTVLLRYIRERTTR